MKKRYLLFVWVACLLTACSESFLDRTPSNQLEKEGAITSLHDVVAATDGLYALMASTYYYNGALFLYGDVKGDDIQATSWSSGRTAYTFYTYEHTADIPNNGGLWGRPYYVIRNAWNIIDAIDAGAVLDATKEELNDYKGQALTAIALCHFDILRCFSYPYAKDNGASPGIPIADHAIGFDEFPDRSKVADCYDFIIRQLKTAIPLLSVEKNDGHINAWAARALLARVYLYCEKNKEAFETADKLIRDIENDGRYRLAARNNYVAQFALDNKFGSEALFQIANTTSSNPGRNGLSYLYHWWGYASLYATDDFAGILDRIKENDVRSKVFRWVGNDYDGWHYVLEKYPGTDYNVPSFENNYTVLRLSEVYLIAAEAGWKAGGEMREPARLYLSRITNRATGSDVGDASFTLDRVLDERRLELVGEGHRYFDMLRNGRTMYRSGGYHFTNITEVNWDTPKCILPINREQFSFNPDMEQNPGYLK